MNLKGLKAVVIVMGVLIVVVFTMIVITLVNRLSDGKGEGADFGELTVPIPQGCTIAQSEAKDERLILRLDGLAERGCQQVLILDLETGRELGRLKAVPAP